jgi:broad specificity phosphatase PhoE
VYATAATTTLLKEGGKDKEVIDQPNYACLADLGPVPSDAVRVYVCRHGQTENNRLRLVQGARVDPPLNDNGIQQAQRLGKALQQASVSPTIILHSPLQRAQQTAVIAATTAATAAAAATAAQRPTIPTKVLESISEIDFGPTSDGTSVQRVKQRMVFTYARWSMGDINAKMASDGETGREVRGVVVPYIYVHSSS